MVYSQFVDNENTYTRTKIEEIEMCEEDPVLHQRFFLLEKKQNVTPIWPLKSEGLLAQDVKPGMEDKPCDCARCISYDIKRTNSCYLRQKLNLMHCITAFYTTYFTMY